ncbi:hypothetical protein ACFL49_02535 [Candidatus Omnitrophota bacterium]
MRHKHHHHRGLKAIRHWRPEKQDIIILVISALIGFLVVVLLSSLQESTSTSKPANSPFTSSPLKPNAEEIQMFKEKFLKNP